MARRSKRTSTYLLSRAAAAKANPETSWRCVTSGGGQAASRHGPEEFVGLAAGESGPAPAGGPAPGALWRRRPQVRSLMRWFAIEAKQGREGGECGWEMGDTCGVCGAWVTGGRPRPQPRRGLMVDAGLGVEALLGWPGPRGGAGRAVKAAGREERKPAVKPGLCSPLLCMSLE